MRYTKFQHWIKLQRKFRKTQKKLLISGDYKLTQKLESIKKRITALNHRWRLGISASVLTAWFAFSPAGTIQAQGPVFKSPVVIEDFNDAKGFFFNGSRFSSEGLGTVVTNIGDFNGDGIDDFVISRPKEAYIIFGTEGEESFEKNSASFFPTTGGLKVVGGQQRDNLGTSITPVGDVNGDGLNDVAFGARYNAENEFNAGSVFIIFGDANISEQKTINVNELDGSNGVAIYGQRVNDGLSLVSSSPLNINNDDVNDLAFVSAVNGTQIIYGSSSIGNDSIIDLSTLNEADGINITRNGESFRASSILSMDINNDGTDDIIVGNSDPRSLDESIRNGEVYTYFGREGNLPDTLDINGSSFNDLTVRGTDQNTNIGRELINIGDINNDGVDDLSISTNDRVYVVFGNDEFNKDSLSVDGLNAENGFVINGDKTIAFASSVSAVGDFSGDGIGDFIIGSPNNSTNGYGAGSAYLIFGREEYTAQIDITSINGSDGIIFHGAERAELGNSLSFLNDINGDGQNELLIGMPGINSGGGGVAVLAGINPLAQLAVVNPINDFIISEDILLTYQIPSNTFSLPSKTDDFIFSATLIDGEELPEWLTFSPETRTFSGTPRNKDTGLLSILVTIETQEGTISTEFNLSVQSANQFPSSQLFSDLDKNDLGAIILFNSGDDNIRRFGSSVGSAGDINGDGIDDFLIGSVGAVNSNNAGAGIVIFGTEEGIDPNFQLSEIDGTNGFMITGTERYSYTGESVSALGDINGDGLDDLIIGARGYYADFVSEKIHVVFGSKEQFPSTLETDDLDGTNGFTITNTLELGTGAFGRAVGQNGDLNGDGLNDIIVGAPFTGEGANIGVTVVFGRDQNSEPFPSNSNLGDIRQDNSLIIQGPDRTGRQVEGIGDLNHDGIDDFVFNATGEADTNFIPGHYVVFGNESLADTLDLSAINGTNGFIVTGASFINSAGDFNGDKIDDIIISGRNEVYVLFGKENGFDPILATDSITSSNGITIKDFRDNSATSLLVNEAKDVNADGLDDVIIGVNYLNSGSDPSAVAHVIFGKNNFENNTFSINEIDGKNGFSVEADSNAVFRITDVSDLGDINNDGFDDVIISDERYNYGGSGSGAVYIIYGKGPVAPVLENPIPDQSAQVNFAFGLTLPDSTFSDANFGDMGIYAARLENGDPLPSWLSFDADSRTFSGTPELADVAVNSIVVTLTDEDDLTASDTFNLAVLENLGPDIDPIANQEVEEETTLTFTVTATDLETAVEDITFSLGTISTDKGMTVSPEGLFSWTPTEAQSGEHLVTLFASDGVSSSEEEFMILVTEVNTAPSLNAIEDLEVGAEREFTFTVEATDPDIPVQDLSFEIDSISFNKGMRIDSASGLISWTPTEEQEGEHSVLLTVTDGELSDSLSFIITVDLELGINELANIGIETFPNPVKDQLNILFNDSFKGNKVYITVQTLSGVSVLTKTASKNLSVLDLSSLESGSYLLVLTSENGKKQVTPLVKQ